MEPADGTYPPRPLTHREEAVLVAMIERGVTMDDDTAVTDADRSRWLAHVPHTRAGRTCGCGTCPSIELTDTDGSTPELHDDRVVLQASATGALLLLFVDEDRLSELELAPLSDKTSFNQFPDPDKLSFFEWAKRPLEDAASVLSPAIPQPMEDWDAEQSLAAIGAWVVDHRFVRRRLPSPRWLPAIALCALTVTGVGAAVASRNDPTYLSIWVGVTSTAFAAALVDASAVIEARRRTAPIERVVQRRLRQTRQLVLSQIRVVFAGLPSTSDGHGPSMAQSLRALPDAPIDLRTDAAAVYPARTRQTYLRELQSQLQALLDDLGSFLAAGVLTDELEAVDRLLRGHSFMILLRDVLVSDVWLKSSTTPAREAADLLDQLDSLLPDRPYDGP